MPTTLTEVFTADDNEYGIVDVEAVDAVTVASVGAADDIIRADATVDLSKVVITHEGFSFCCRLYSAEDAERRDTIEAYAYLARHDAEEALGDWNVDGPVLRLRRGHRVCQTA